jgi:hypothetical protein
MKNLDHKITNCLRPIRGRNDFGPVNFKHHNLSLLMLTCGRIAKFL